MGTTTAALLATDGCRAAGPGGPRARRHGQHHRRPRGRRRV